MTGQDCALRLRDSSQQRVATSSHSEQETPMAQSVVTAPLVRDHNLPAPLLTVSRITDAVVLIAGATLQLVEELIEPPFATDTERFAWMAQHTTLHAVDVEIGPAAFRSGRSMLHSSSAWWHWRRWRLYRSRACGWRRTSWSSCARPSWPPRSSGSTRRPLIRSQSTRRCRAGLITYPLLFDNVQVLRRDQIVPAQPADLRCVDRFSPTS